MRNEERGTPAGNSGNQRSQYTRLPRRPLLRGGGHLRGQHIDVQQASVGVEPSRRLGALELVDDVGFAGDNERCDFNPSRNAVDLTFLRTLASSRLPRRVPVGPAFQLVLNYHAAGYVVAEFPSPTRTRYGYTAQPDAIVLAVTALGLASIKDGPSTPDEHPSA